MEGHQIEASMLPYRNADSEAPEEITQPTPRLPTLMSSQFSSPPPSWYIPAETDSLLATSTAGPNFGHLALGSVAYDRPARDHAYHNQRWTLPCYPCRYEPRVVWDPIGLPSSASRPVKALDGTFYGPFPRFVGYRVVYTDDARMKPGDGVHRQCFNCRITETTTWRRSMLNLGKLLCNKCGLFERTHGVPRPKAFPRRRRNRPLAESADESVTSAPLSATSDGHCNSTNKSPYASQFPDAFKAVDGTTTSENTQWTTHDIPRVSPTPSHLSSPHGTIAEQPMAYHTDLQLPSAVPPTDAYAAPSWGFLSTPAN